MVPLFRLRALVRDHRGPLRADLRREYGIDLDAVLADGSIRPAVLLDLIDGLSPQSALARAIDPSAAWSLTEHMLATLIDQMSLLLWVQPGTKGPRPKPLVRPGVAESDEEGTKMIGATDGFDSIEEFREWYRLRPAEPAD